MWKGIVTPLCMAVFMGVGRSAVAEPFHKTSPVVGYRCLFNHELLIVCHVKDMNPRQVGSFIEKLVDTDVDAVMCCPGIWRTNVFPSKVDPQWTKHATTEPASKLPYYESVKRYLLAGGDPVKDTLEACRKYKKDFFISYRMNDQHYVTDRTWPTHNFIWREHPEYWLGDSDTSPYSRGKDNVRLLDYMRPEVRGYYFSIIEELCTNYDVDGVELDFQRFPRFFHNDKVKEGTRVMTALVGRIRAMLDRIGKERGKSLKLCVRVPETVAKCEAAGLDVNGWDGLGLVDMINVSSFYIHTMELGIEEFKARTKRAKIYGEMNYVTWQTGKPGKLARRYTTIETYRASALNLFRRGVDGVSLFNYDYVPSKHRVAMTEGLKRITDVEYLRTAAKQYVVYPGFGTFTARNARTFDIIIPDDTTAVKFERAIMRVETREKCQGVRIDVALNGTPLEACEHQGVELFAPVSENESYAGREAVKFYAVPLKALVCGKNTVRIRNVDKAKGSVTLFSMELGLHR
ncbi:MAG: hypothetical protein JXQ73_12350 [Phycisphaerae bacterium]|nr:hypothetical protein [Phycisphaerae bacterium]